MLLENLPQGFVRLTRLGLYFTGKNVTEWCEYLYDFGDDLRHDVS